MQLKDLICQGNLHIKTKIRQINERFIVCIMLDLSEEELDSSGLKDCQMIMKKKEGAVKQPTLKDLVLKGFVDINNQFQQVNDQFKQVNDQFKQVNDQFQQVNDRMDKRFDQVDKQFAQVNKRLDTLEKLPTIAKELEAAKAKERSD